MNLISTDKKPGIFPLAKIIGHNKKVPLSDGRISRYINLDNAASTPALKSVYEFIQNFIPYYSSVHRGSGFKSQLSTELYDRAHNVVAEFFGAKTETNTVILTKNTTEAINQIACRFPFRNNSVILSSVMEHHSNDLPWRTKAPTKHIKINSKGCLDLDDLKLKLKKYGSRVALVCVSGASNVTGLVQPIHKIAKMAHQAGAKILVDAAQLAPHRKIEIKDDNHPEHIDFLVASAHKMYAPFGTGVLIGPKKLFLDSAPNYSGGGTVKSVTLDDIQWAGLPDREEAGSPNIIGALALAKAITELEVIGMKHITAHEEKLTNYALEVLQDSDRVTIYGDLNAERVGVISFTVDGISHFQLAAALSYEYGIGVRNGCFCAHPYVVQLLRLKDEDIRGWKNQLTQGNKSAMPGLVRISFGCYNTMDDVRAFSSALQNILRSGLSVDYNQDKASGMYFPKNRTETSLNRFLKVHGLSYH